MNIIYANPLLFFNAGRQRFQASLSSLKPLCKWKSKAASTKCSFYNINQKKVYNKVAFISMHKHFGWKFVNIEGLQFQILSLAGVLAQIKIRTYFSRAKSLSWK